MKTLTRFLFTMIGLFALGSLANNVSAQNFENYRYDIYRTIGSETEFEISILNKITTPWTPAAGVPIFCEDMREMIPSISTWTNPNGKVRIAITEDDARWEPALKIYADFDGRMVVIGTVLFRYGYPYVITVEDYPEYIR